MRVGLGCWGGSSRCSPVGSVAEGRVASAVCGWQAGATGRNHQALQPHLASVCPLPTPANPSPPPSQVGLNNMKQNDYANVVVQSLIRIHPIRSVPAACLPACLPGLPGGHTACRGLHVCLPGVPARLQPYQPARLAALSSSPRAARRRVPATVSLTALSCCRSSRHSTATATSSCGQRTTSLAAPCWCSALASW